MALHVDITKLDADIKFLRDEADRLRAMSGAWAKSKAARFDEIVEFLVEVRRDHQMTGIGGKRIDEEISPTGRFAEPHVPPYHELPRK